MNKHHPNPHSKFFSSLNHLHKRLKLDPTTTTTTTLPPPPPSSSQPSQSPLPSPLFLHHPNPPSTTHSTLTPPPLEFLSTPTSPLPPPPPHYTTHSNHTDDYIDVDVDVDEIGLLVGLLGLSVSDVGVDYLSEFSCSCRCDGGFYDKVVGVKGPKCNKEVDRLDGWIRCFMKERLEPFRLVHLLLGKASFGGSLGGVEFPSTVDGFLLLDPPPPKDV